MPEITRQQKNGDLPEFFVMKRKPNLRNDLTDILYEKAMAGDIDAIKFLWEQVHGKASQKSNHQKNGGSFDPTIVNTSNLTTKEKEALRSFIQKSVKKE